MLVLTRKPREEIRIGNGITITILRVKGQQVRVGIEAPNDVRIVRGELDFEIEPEDATPQGSPILPPKVAERCNSIPIDFESHSSQATPSSDGKRRKDIQDEQSSVSHCRIKRPDSGKSVLRLLAERQRAKDLLNPSNGVQLPPR